METGVQTPETDAAGGKAKLRRALRTAIDVAAIAPTIVAALEGNSAQPDVARAFGRIDELLSPLRSKLASIDADDDVCAAAGLITEQHIKSISVSEKPMSAFLCVGPCLFNIAIIVSYANGLLTFPVPMAQSL